MRPILPTDLDWAARVLLAAPHEDWVGLLARRLLEAETADKARKRTGKTLNGQGGSLMDAALSRPRFRDARFCDAEYCAALAATLDGIAAWRSRALP